MTATQNAPRYSAPKTCTRCKGLGTIAAYYYNNAGACFDCGGHGWIAGATTELKKVEVEDGFVRLTHRAADHRPAVWTVSVHSYRHDVEEASTTHDSLEAGRAAANAAYRTLVAQTEASNAAEAARRAASKAAWAAKRNAEAILIGLPRLAA